MNIPVIANQDINLVSDGIDGTSGKETGAGNGFREVLNTNLVSGENQRKEGTTNTIVANRNHVLNHDANPENLQETLIEEGQFVSILDGIVPKQSITLNEEVMAEEAVGTHAYVDELDCINLNEEMIAKEPDQGVELQDALILEENMKTVSEFAPDTSILDNVVSEIKNTLKEILDITEEQLEKLLEETGISIMGLFQPDMQKNLILNQEGTKDFSAFLTSETLVTQFSKIQDTFHMKSPIGEEISSILTEQKDLGFLEQIVEQMQKPIASTEDGTTARGSLLSENADILNSQGYQITDEMIQSENIIHDTAMLQMNHIKGAIGIDTDASNDKMQTNLTSEETEANDMTSTKHKEENIEISVVSYKKDTDLKQGDYQQSKNSFSKDTIQQNALQQFIQNLAASDTGSVETFDDKLMEQMRNIVNQVVKQIKVMVKPETTSVEMQLNPEHLGKVNLSIVSKGGVLAAELVVKDEMAKQALESQIQVLRENLNNQGLKVEAVEVSVSNFDFAQSGQTDSGQRQDSKKKTPRKLDLNMLEDSLGQLSEEEALAAKVMISNGNQVDYTA